MKAFTTTDKSGKCYMCEWTTSAVIPVEDMLIYCCSDRTCQESFNRKNLTDTLINKRHVYPKQRIQEYLWTYPYNVLMDDHIYIGNALGT